MDEEPILSPAEQEELLQLALQAVIDSGLNKAGNPIFSLRAAAKHYIVDRSTLTRRYNGGVSRTKSHAAQQKLPPAQEDVLKDWIKVLGRRGIPLALQAIAEYASHIIEEDVSVNWARGFRTRHPDLKARWTTGLESCRAQCLNRALVSEYFDILEDLITTYNIPIENIYNMDEKGIQMGVGRRTMVLVDRDQKGVVYHIEDGNRELVTIIETVCADGTALHPSVIFKGKTWDLEWGRNNPANASISYSPKGWTDNELGSKWLEKDFEPASAARNTSNGYRLLILDGHNSHCTYSFCSFAETKKILILCLVAHTTHRCQPCDVGVFGPLASSWKAEVMTMARKSQKISKYNILKHYAHARTKAFTPTTIRASFRKTGIWPTDRTVIEESAYEPALNTTTHGAQPVPATLPALLEPIPIPSTPSITSEDVPTHPNSPASTSHEDTPNGPSSLAHSSASAHHGTPPTPGPSSASAPPETPLYRLANFPPALPPTASRGSLLERTRQLEQFAEAARAQMAADHASKKLMDAENERLRQQLYAKQNKPKKQRVGGAGARHMTNEETLKALSRVDWTAAIAEVHAQMKELERFVELKATCDNTWKEMVEREKRAEKEAADVEKAQLKAIADAEKARLKAIADVEKARLKAVADAEKAVEKARLKAVTDAEKAAEKARLKAVADAEKARLKEIADAERQRKKEETDAARVAKKAEAAAEKARKKAEEVVSGAGKKKRKRKDTHPAGDENAPLTPPNELEPPAEK